MKMISDLITAVIYIEFDESLGPAPKIWIPTDFSPETGIKTETWTRDKVYAIRGEFSIKELAFWQGAIELGDAVFLINKADYLDDLGTDLDKDDQILEFRYETGRVAVTNSSTSVTGTGTTWTTNAGKGDFFKLKHEDDYYEIASNPTSDTALTLSSNYSNVTKTSQPYEIYSRWLIINVMKDILNSFRKVHCRRLR